MKRAYSFSVIIWICRLMARKFQEMLPILISHSLYHINISLFCAYCPQIFTDWLLPMWLFSFFFCSLCFDISFCTLVSCGFVKIVWILKFNQAIRVVRLGARCTDHWTTGQSRGVGVPAVQLTTHVKSSTLYGRSYGRTVVRSLVQIFSAWWVTTTILYNCGATLCELH